MTPSLYPCHRNLEVGVLKKIILFYFILSYSLYPIVFIVFYLILSYFFISFILSCLILSYLVSFVFQDWSVGERYFIIF